MTAAERLARDIEIIRGHRQGMSDRAIAAQVDCSPTTVGNVLRAWEKEHHADTPLMIPMMIPLTDLLPHPDNPRIAIRQDVVDKIVVQLQARGFGVEHAILTRAVNEHHQILAGHHRVEAARLAGLSEIPCWVREMDDDEALMQLVLSNAQGELAPLEIGIHALRAVPLSKGGRGKTGGLSEYAEHIGRSKQSVAELRSGAEVLETVRSADGFRPELLERAKHLYEISKAPRKVWPLLVDALIKRKWTVTDTAGEVATIKQFRVPAEHEIEQVVQRYLSSGERPTADEADEDDEDDEPTDEPTDEPQDIDGDATDTDTTMDIETIEEFLRIEKRIDANDALIREWAERRPVDDEPVDDEPTDDTAATDINGEPITTTDDPVDINGEPITEDDGSDTGHVEELDLSEFSYDSQCTYADAQELAGWLQREGFRRDDPEAEKGFEYISDTITVLTEILEP